MNSNKKEALKYDDYNIITVETYKESKTTRAGVQAEHRSPREHLRRGHIKRVHYGENRSLTKKVWINAVVVNAGIGGKLYKDYKVTT